MRLQRQSLSFPTESADVPPYSMNMQVLAYASYIAGSQDYMRFCCQCLLDHRQ